MPSTASRPLSALLVLLLIVTTAAVVAIPFVMRFKRARLLPSLVMNDAGSIPADSLAVDSSRVVSALEDVIDPEIGYSVVELGLVHLVRVDSAQDVRVVLALTTPECPYGSILGEAAVEALRQIPGAKRIQVRLDPRVRWNPEMMTGRARERYEKVFKLGRTSR